MEVTFTPLPTVSSLKLCVKASTKNLVDEYTANQANAWKEWPGITNYKPELIRGDFILMCKGMDVENKL